MNKTFEPIAVYFDVDGTLFEPEHLLHEVVSISLLDNGAPEHYNPEWCIHKFMGKHPEQICAFVNEEENTTISHDSFKTGMVRAFKKIANARPEEMIACDGAAEFLEYLTSYNIPVGVVSNGLQKNVEIALSSTGLIDFFDKGEIITPCLGHGLEAKPSPIMLLELANVHDLNNRASEIFYIGNSSADMGAAKNANMIAVGYTGAEKKERAGFHKMSLEAAGADYVYNSFEEIKKKLLPELENSTSCKFSQDLG